MELDETETPETEEAATDAILNQCLGKAKDWPIGTRVRLFTVDAIITGYNFVSEDDEDVFATTEVEITYIGVANDLRGGSEVRTKDVSLCALTRL